MDNWTLHNLEEDFSESTDVRVRHPDKLDELVNAFDEAAWTNLVYPLHNRDRLQKFADSSPALRAAADLPRTFYPGTQTSHREDILPLIDDRSFQEAMSWTALSPTMSFGAFEGLDVGIDRRGPVSWELYERHGAFAYSGEIRDVLVTPGKRASASGD